MNPWRITHCIFSFWWLWLFIGATAFAVRTFGWSNIWPGFAVIGGVLLFAVIVTAYGEFLDWLDTKAIDYGWRRSKRAEQYVGSGDVK